MINAITEVALRYQRIEQVLKLSTSPMTVAMLWENPSIREVCKGIHNVCDALLALKKKRQVRKIPFAGVGKSRNAYEWAHKGLTIPREIIEVTLKQRVAPLIKESKNMSQDINLRPEITVTKTGITVVTEKFKLTIEL